MRIIGNMTIKSVRKDSPQTAESEDILLEQMEIFIIVVAVVAVAAALILLILLQIRIKKQTEAENQAVINREAVRLQTSQIEEIALDYPNDPFLKTGPPPYRQVMKSPELYPLSPTKDVRGNGEVKIQILQSPAHNQRTRLAWSQFLNAVIRTDDEGPHTPPGKYTNGDDQVEVHDVPSVDEVLPTYHDVCAGIANEESECRVERLMSRRDSADIVKSGRYDFLGFNFGIEKSKLCKNDCVFTISKALQTAITTEITRSTGRPRLATL